MEATRVWASTSVKMEKLASEYSVKFWGTPTSENVYKDIHERGNGRGEGTNPDLPMSFLGRDLWKNYQCFSVLEAKLKLKRNRKLSVHIYKVKPDWNLTKTKPKHNHIILIDHCFVSVSVFSWKLKQKRNRKVSVPPNCIARNESAEAWEAKRIKLRRLDCRIFSRY